MRTSSDATLISTFVAANVVPLLVVLWLYKRRKSFEIQSAREEFAVRRKAHLQCRRSRSTAHGIRAVGGIQNLDRSWFGVCSDLVAADGDEDGANVTSVNVRTITPGVVPFVPRLALTSSTSGASSSERKLERSRSFWEAQAGKKAVCESEQALPLPSYRDLTIEELAQLALNTSRPAPPLSASASVPPVCSRVPRQHFEIRRRRRPTPNGTLNPLSRDSLRHKNAWFNAPETAIRNSISLAAKPNPNATRDGESDDNDVDSQGAGVEVEAVGESASASGVIVTTPQSSTPEATPLAALVGPAITPTEEVHRHEILPSHGRTTHTVPPDTASASAAFVDEIRRRGEALNHVDVAAEQPAVNQPPGVPMLEMQLRANEMAARRAHRASCESDSPAPAQTLTGGMEPSPPAPLDRGPPDNGADKEAETPVADKATARSEAAMARARARARARAGATVGLPAAPAPDAVSVSNQQAWLMAAMGAASEQEYAPIEVQHDWLTQAIEEVGPEDQHDPFLNLPLAPAAAPGPASPRSLFNLSPRRLSRADADTNAPLTSRTEAPISPRSPRLSSPRLGLSSLSRRGSSALSPRGGAETTALASGPAPAATRGQSLSPRQLSRELFPAPAEGVNESHVYV